MEDMGLDGEIKCAQSTRSILQKKFSKVLASEPSLKIKTPSEEYDRMTFYEISAEHVQIYIDASVAIPCQMKTTIARNYYRMNEGDDSEKNADKFGDIEKLHNLFALLKSASTQEEIDEADPIASGDCRKVTVFAIIDLLISA